MRYLLVLLCLTGATACWAAPSKDVAAIQDLYARYQKAYITKDVKPVMAMTAANFTASMKDGKKLTRAEYQAVMTQQLKTTAKETFKVDGLAVQGDKATAITEETITAPPIGTHEIGSRCRGRDSWVRTPSGWRIDHTESLEEVYTMDGQPFDPSQFKKP